MDKLSFHEELTSDRFFYTLRKPSLWVVDDVSETSDVSRKRMDYRLVRLVHAKKEEPSQALYYYANKDIVVPEYQYESSDNTDTRIGYGKAYYFDRKKTKELSSKNRYMLGFQQNLLEPFHLNDTIKRNSDLEFALKDDIRSIQQTIEGNRISYKEGDASNICVEDEEIIQIHTFNVGQGDTIVIQFPNKRVWIIDAYFRWNSMFSSFQSWLNREVPGFDCDKLILSHLHYDHIKDAIKLMNFAKPKEVIYHGIQTTPTPTAVNVLNHAVDRCNLVWLRRTEQLELGKARIQLIPTDELTTMKASNDVNTKGIIVTIETPDSQVLLPGDVHGDQLAELLKNRFIINKDKTSFYKVTHHCSSTGSNTTFLNSINPTNAVTSCGKNNKYKHPSSVSKHRIDHLTRRNNGSHSITADSNLKYISWDIH